MSETGGWTVDEKGEPVKLDPVVDFAMAPSIALLSEALSKAQGKFTHADKSHKADAGTKGRYKYATMAEVVDACRAALSEHGLSVVQVASTLRGGAFVRVRTILSHASGEYIMGVFDMPSGKPWPQEIGSALTYAKRYAWSAMVGVATDDDDGADANAAAKEAIKPPPRQATEEAKPAAAKDDSAIYERLAKERERLAEKGLDAAEWVEEVRALHKKKEITEKTVSVLRALHKTLSGEVAEPGAKG